MIHFSPESIHAHYYIQRYEPGCVTINKKHYHHSVILFEDQLIPWSITTFTELDRSSLDMLLNYQADFILVGTGAKQHFAPTALSIYLTQGNHAVDFMSSQMAASTYNLLAQESRRPLLALIIE